jgi:hypothetical protein
LKIYKTIYIIFILGLQSLITASIILETSFINGNNSDLLFPAMLLSDIQNNSKYLQDWVLAPAPCFFPDLFLYFLIDTGEIGSTIFLYVTIFTISLFILVSKMIIKTEKLFQSFDIIYIFMIVNILLLSNSKLSFFYSPTYHSSIYLFGVFCIINKNTYNRKLTIFIYGISFLFGLSDPFVLLQIIIPLLFYTLISNYSDKSSLKSELMYYIKAFLFSFLGKLFINGLHKNKLIIVPEVPIFKTFFYILKNFLFIENLSKTFHYCFDELFEFKLVYICVLLFISIFVFDKKQKNREILWTFLFTFILLFTFQGWFGLWIGYRYMWFFYIFPLAYIVFYLLQKLNFQYQTKEKANNKGIFKKEYIKLSLPILILALQFFYFQKSIETIINFYRKESLNKELNSSIQFPVNYANQKILPPVVKCITDLSKKYNLVQGVSDYWNAKYITFFSNNQVLVNQYTYEIDEYYWINNKSLYKLQKEPVRYNFIITNRLNENKIIELIGNPDWRELCGENHIWIYKNYFQIIAKINPP